VQRKLNKPLEDQKLKICFVSHGLEPVPPHGADTASLEAHRLAVEMVALGHKVDVISMPDPARVDQPYNVLEVKAPRLAGSGKLSYVFNELSFGACTARTLGRRLEERAYDVVHFHANVTAFLCHSLMSQRSSAPFILTYGGPVFGFSGARSPKNLRDVLSISKEMNISRAILPVSLFMEWKLFREFSKVIVVSNVLKARIEEFYGLTGRLEAIPPGVETGIFRPNLDCRQLKERYAINEGDLVVLCLARVTPFKGQLRLINAIPYIIRRHPNTKFLFVGPISSKNYWTTIRETVENKSLQERVIFTGSVELTQLPEYYNLADVFVLPTIAEGLPSTLLEAMSCGRAVVTSSIPQNKEAAVHGDEAIFVNPYDTRAIAEAIVLLLDNQELRTKMGKNARRTILELFDWRAIARKTTKVYIDVLSRWQSESARDLE
jgi:glycosyltransferase involved in cell wall biosynthesis